jgi:hypothetical protein
MSQIPVKQMTDSELIYSWLVSESEGYDDLVWDELDTRKVSNKSCVCLLTKHSVGKVSSRSSKTPIPQMTDRELMFAVNSNTPGSSKELFNRVHQVSKSYLK